MTIWTRRRRGDDPKFLCQDSGRTGDFCSRYGHRRRRMETRWGAGCLGRPWAQSWGFKSSLSRGDKVEMLQGTGREPGALDRSRDGAGCWRADGHRDLGVDKCSESVCDGVDSQKRGRKKGLEGTEGVIRESGGEPGEEMTWRSRWKTGQEGRQQR